MMFGRATVSWLAGKGLEANGVSLAASSGCGR
jgi:hypothetical protein